MDSETSELEAALGDAFKEFCVPSSLLSENVKPFPYQWTGALLLVKKTRFLLADDPGLGKTVQAIVGVNFLSKLRGEDQPALKVLVICPKSMLITWEREISKWSVGKASFTIINHDRLIGKDAHKFRDDWDVVIADESHLYIKNEDTQRCHAFQVLIKGVARVWLMTATPASKSALDYYVTLKILLPTIFEKWSRSRFQREFCQEFKDPWAYSGKRYDGFKNTDILKKVFEACALRRKQEEVKGDLPPLTFTDTFCDINHKNLIHFSPEEAADIRRRVMEGETFSAHYQAAMKHNALLKVPTVLELLHTYPDKKKVVIFAWHRTVVDKIVKEIEAEGDRTVDKITGEINSPEVRQAIIDRFQTGDLDTLVLNMQSGGVGITLTAATIGIYVQFPFSVTHWVQSIKRIHRIGSEFPVQIVKLIIKDSIDEDIFGVLTERMKYIKEVGV